MLAKGATERLDTGLASESNSLIWQGKEICKPGRAQFILIARI